jgi:O-antigen biosynthesis protein WbqP
MYLGKRLLDIFFSTFLIIMFFFPMIFMYFMIILVDRNTPIYYSQRVGQKSRIFIMPKFRTMRAGSPQIAKNKINPNTITRLGKFLRTTSMDELPQLFCVFSGKMSLVGPRPALFNQYDLIRERKKHKIDQLKTGITGYAQINGRDSISLTKKIILDKYYLERASFLLDLKIIFLTCFKVIGIKDILH